MKKHLLGLGISVWFAVTAFAAPATFERVGDWQVRVTAAGVSTVLRIAPSPRFEVKGEKISPVPALSKRMSPWAMGVQLAAVKACECCFSGALDPKSLRVYSAEGQDFTAGKDYQPETFWGCVARLPDGRIGPQTEVFADYAWRGKRIDTLALGPDQRIVLHQGTPHAGRPVPPTLGKGERALGNVWITPQTVKLTDDNLFPIQETAYPESPKASPCTAEQLLPKTYAKLVAGQPVTILAWGDSVTACTFLPAADAWHAQFLKRLKARFPKAKITLLVEAWPGHNTYSYRAAPPGSIHNYQEKVLARKPDLIISEFVNDADMNQQAVDKMYGLAWNEFRAAGIEWIILTPHYVRLDWMRLTSEKNIDSDPRPYVIALRQFAAAHQIALADASLRWGRLWRRGIPYSSLFVNNINHPNAFGMSLFADALLALF